jgi:hypothetical protein
MPSVCFQHKPQRQKILGKDRLFDNLHFAFGDGSENFVVKLETILDRMLRPKKAGRPKKRIRNRDRKREK